LEDGAYLPLLVSMREKNNRCCSGGCGGDGAGHSVHVETRLDLVEEGPVCDSGGCRGEGCALAGVLALT
jgi:hypothetical protein